MDYLVKFWYFFGILSVTFLVAIKLLGYYIYRVVNINPNIMFLMVLFFILFIINLVSFCFVSVVKLISYV